MNHKSSILCPVTEITIGIDAIYMYTHVHSEHTLMHLYHIYVHVHVHLYPVQGEYYRSGMLIDKNARNSL